jgi:hypothetical protein
VTADVRAIRQPRHGSRRRPYAGPAQRWRGMAAVQAQCTAAGPQCRPRAGGGAAACAVAAAGWAGLAGLPQLLQVLVLRGVADRPGTTGRTRLVAPPSWPSSHQRAAARDRLRLMRRAPAAGRPAHAADGRARSAG